MNAILQHSEKHFSSLPCNSLYDKTLAQLRSKGLLKLIPRNLYDEFHVSAEKYCCSINIMKDSDLMT